MKIVAAVFFTLLLMVAPVGATVIGFDDDLGLGIIDGYGPNTVVPFNGLTPKGTVLTNQYSSLGVLFSTQNAAGTSTAAWVSSSLYIGAAAGV